jgi:predicted small secreted protein
MVESMRGFAMIRILKQTAFIAVLLSSLLLAGCSANVGVGMSVGVPIGSHGYMTVGGSRWH